jgi:hypothetical protein
MMSRKTHGQGTPDWLKVVICLTVVIGAAAGAGHVADGSAPTTACVEYPVRLILAKGASR